MLFLSFFKSLDGEQVIVELKNGLKLQGRLVSVDLYHNIKLSDVNAVESAKYPHFSSVSSLFIRGSVVRYISLPVEKVDLDLLHESCRRSHLRSSAQ